MKNSNTAKRLRQLMDERNLKQVDILNSCIPFCTKYNVKMNKSDISQYVSGKVEPNQDKLFILGSALNVNEAWLMGFNVPMERNDDQNIIRFDAELEDSLNIIESAGFSYSFSDAPDNDIIIVKNKANTTVACMHDYELVNVYESLHRRGGFVNAELLLCLDKDPEAYSKIYAIPKPGSARYAFSNIDNRLTDIVYHFQKLNEQGKQRAYDYVSDLAEQPKYTTPSITSADVQPFPAAVQEPDPDYLKVNAAQTRTDIDIPEGADLSESDIMDDDNF